MRQRGGQHRQGRDRSAPGNRRAGPRARPFLSFLSFLPFLAFLTFLAPGSPGAAAPARPPAPDAVPAAGITIDLDAGAVLDASEENAARWPASLAKLMTAYIAFAALADGGIAEDTPVTVSAHAAAQPPVKAWLVAGKSYRFDALLAAATVASANDAAMAVAEAVAGDEAAFVARMNDAADRLGMTRTRFANPHGLPKPGQRTTARDMARLAAALVDRFPTRSRLFSRHEARIGGRRLSTTNPLFGRYPGALGLKTGFTCRAGYNIVAMAERAGRRILSVALGARTSTERLARIRAQLDAGFAASADGAPIAAAAPPPSAEPPPAVGACVPSPGGAGRGPSGWSVFLGAKAGRGWASRTAARAAAQVGGAQYVGRRRDRLWTAMLHGFTRQQAIRACASLRRKGGFCLTLSPKARRIRARLWR